MSTSTQVAALGGRIRRAYFWTIIGSTARYLAGFAISIVLTRLLKPVDYGLIGMVTVFIEFSMAMYDTGLSNAVIHFKEDNSDRERATYFTVALLIGLLFAALLFITAPVIARFYHEPRLIPLLWVMSPVLILGSVKNISAGILARELRFRALSLVEVIASLVAGILAVIMAYLGFGVWSLVANLVVFTVLLAVMYGQKVRPQFRLPLDRAVLKRLWRYGSPLTASSLLNKFYDNADYLVVGKILGPVMLGYYTVAFRLAMLINDRISAVINRVAFPSFANLKDDPKEAVAHWFAVTKRVTLLTFPLLIWLVFNAADFVRVALGVRWLPAVLPLQFLCVMTAVKILTNVMGQILAAVGHPAVVFRFDVLTAVVLPLAFLVGCKQGGLLGMGIAWCTVFPCLRFLFFLAARRTLHFSARAYAKNLMLPSLVSLIAALVMAPVQWLLPSGWLRLTLSTILWAASLIACIAAISELRKLFVSVVRPLLKLQLQ
jgi:teichuronic acid exporter